MEEKNLPEKRFTTGAISATIWKNQTKNKQGSPIEFRTVSFDRRYKDKEGEWKSTSSLNATDVPKAVLVLGKAYEYITLKEKQEIAA